MMIALLAEMFGYAFLVRAFVVGALVSVCAALLGVSLVLKRYSMIGDGLSHVGFGSLALATALNAAPLAVAIPVVVAAAFLLLRLSDSSKIKGDAAVALISTGSLALGVLIISRTTGMNTDVCNYLFGSILAMNRTDVYLSAALSAGVLVLFILFYHKLFAVTFDETFAKAAGIPTGMYNMLIALLTALTIVLGMRMMGAMLISSLIVFPALTAMRLFKQFKTVSVCSVLVSGICFFSGVIISYLYAVPTGASVVLVNIIMFALFWLAGSWGPRVMRQLPKVLTLLLALCVLSLAGCGGVKNAGLQKNRAGTQSVQAPAAGKAFQGGGAAGEGVIEIKEKMFIAQTNDVYLNPQDYLGKTITLEGLFKMAKPEGREAPYCFVLRYGPGCCGSDGNAGFEVAWDSDGAAFYPREDDWVEASGTLKTYIEDEFPYIYISLSRMKVLDTRGAEYVSQ
jgi:zinc transport system permease protein